VPPTRLASQSLSGAALQTVCGASTRDVDVFTMFMASFSDGAPG
jgi:hypothetical protein